MSGDRVVIHYRRPPDREQEFTQDVVTRTAECIITLLPTAPIGASKLIDNVIALEPGAPVVWFTFPDAWHDIGRFHTRAGTFTGCYANVLTPVAGLGTPVWHTTDLFLDVWQPADGSPVLLDADELDAAHAQGWIDDRTWKRAHTEADALLARAAEGAWPPPIVHAWPLERVLRHVGD